MKTCYLLLAIPFFLLQSNIACSAERNYKTAHLDAGRATFNKNCAICHGQDAAGTVSNWQTPGEDGKLPPPPLNGTAHAWHHSTTALFNTIMNGTQHIGGSMPPFKGSLSEEQALQIIYWLTSLWPDELFQAWQKQN